MRTISLAKSSRPSGAVGAPSHKQILNGPTADELFAAFRSGRPIAFMLERGEQLHMVISAVEAEDGSRRGWNCAGYDSRSGGSCKLYYHADKRQGVTGLG